MPPPENVLKGAALKEATKALGTTLAEEAPIRSSANVVYATVASLPGTPFNPGARGSVQVHPDGSIALSPGDYQLGVQVFCMAATSHSPSGNTFQLAPLQGKWADIIAAVQSRGTLQHIAHNDLQMLSWQLQAGLKYEELSARSRSLIDQLAPEHRGRLGQSYWEKIQSTWSQYVSRIPGAPSMDSMLDQMGDVGRAIRAIEVERATLLSYQNDYEYVARMFAPSGSPGHQNAATTPWSIVSNGVYARLIMSGTYHGPGTIEVRVASGTAKTHLTIASTLLEGLGNSMLAQSGGVPGGIVGVPNAAVQPMGIAPDPPSPGPSPSTSPGCNTAPFGSGVDGVPNGKLTHPFHNENHPGTDVFAPRDTPVYADIQPEVPVDELNKLPLFKQSGNLGISETGNLKLVDATVTLQPWAATGDWDWGGIVRLTLHYQGGSGTIYPVNLEYLHLITNDKHPRNDLKQWIDNKGSVIGPEEYKGCMGFGPQMKNGAKLSAADLANRPLIGYEGATQTSHTHIQSWYSLGGKSAYFDPQLLLASN